MVEWQPAQETSAEPMNTLLCLFNTVGIGSFPCVAGY